MEAYASSSVSCVQGPIARGVGRKCSKLGRNLSGSGETVEVERARAQGGGLGAPSKPIGRVFQAHLRPLDQAHPMVGPWETIGGAASRAHPSPDPPCCASSPPTSARS